MTTALTCPKCRGRMETYTRSGITIDQCTDCRGIYLDRGELPLLIDAEAAYFHPQEPAPATPGPSGAPRAPDNNQPAAHQP